MIYWIISVVDGQNDDLFFFKWMIKLCRCEENYFPKGRKKKIVFSSTTVILKVGVTMEAAGMGLGLEGGLPVSRGRGWRSRKGRGCLLHGGRRWRT